MVPVTPLPNRRRAVSAKSLVLVAVEAAGGSSVVASACGVSRQHVERWTSEDDTRLPNLGHILGGPPSFARSVATSVLAFLDRNEPVLRECDLVPMAFRLGALVGRVLIEAESLSRATCEEEHDERQFALSEAIRAVIEQGRQIERGLHAAREARAAERGGVK